MYGLKHAPRVWYKDIDTFLTSSAGFQRCPDEPNVYIGGTRPFDDPDVYFHGEGSSFIILLIYVDDMLLFSPALSTITPVMTMLNEKYKMSSMSEASIFLGRPS